VRVFLGFALGVVLAVDRGPLTRQHAGGHPQPYAEEVAGDRMQLQRAVRLAAVQIHRHADDRHVRDGQREQRPATTKSAEARGKENRAGNSTRQLPVVRAMPAKPTSENESIPRVDRNFTSTVPSLCKK
jgi:hypothetical protein